MEMAAMLKEKPKWMLAILVGVVLVSIKRVFTDFDIDCEYAIALSYRMVRGDHMIAQMWEPHQTSAFLNAILIALYLFLTGTTTGIALYLNIVGLAAKLGVAYVFCRTFRKFCNRNILFLMCAFFLTVNAKNSIILDFSNMMIYFSILLLCSLFSYLQRQERPNSRFLVLSAACFCLEVLSYPSSIMLFPFLLVILYHYSGTKRRDIALFTAICIFAGTVFFLFLIMQTGWNRFWECVRMIVMGDSTHKMGDFVGRMQIYLADIGDMAILFAVCAVLSGVIVKSFLRKRTGAKKEYFVRVFFVLLLLCNFAQMVLDTGEDTMFRTRRLDPAIYLPISFLAFRLRGYCSKEEKMAFLTGMGISIGGFLAVLFLTNLTFMTTLSYMIPGIMVSMMPIGEYLHQKPLKSGGTGRYGVMLLFMAVFIFRNVYVVRPMNRMYLTLPSIGGVVKDGPMIGIFSDYMGAYIRNSNLSDWRRYVREGDRILIVGHSASTIGYLYEDTEISVDSTICTPTYNEKLLSYWEMNPWKEPNVVILDCWFGEPDIPEDEWIMQWIGDNFEVYDDGAYIRVYRRE